MSETQIIPDLAEVLAEVNRLRGERGMKALSEMPRGLVGSSRKCPLACALGVPVGVDYLHFEPLVFMPKTLGAFRAAFDREAYPGLMA